MSEHWAFGFMLFFAVMIYTTVAVVAVVTWTLINYPKLAVFALSGVLVLTVWDSIDDNRHASHQTRLDEFTD